MSPRLSSFSVAPAYPVSPSPISPSYRRPVSLDNVVTVYKLSFYYFVNNKMIKCLCQYPRFTNCHVSL